MPSESKPLLATQTEKAIHYTYLKEFRVEQCPLFLQHKCTQHRPFTCFHWHFMNQRRRRPIRRRDGTFNYNPDVYCTKYDETTGICPDGDDCQYLHRTAGDTERRYHLRYYKTGMCVHDTDARGYCVKNGPHCAFAHGALDLRPPVYDIRELQAMENPESEGGSSTNGPNILDKERNMMNEDPKWQDTNYVLANYKTEPCKRPPRLCRQGYACPQYHNSRDRRRSPRKFKCRSTPCPNVKHGDEWGEPSNCENGDMCQYCHTRTEQQFHPEIYKSTKCNDMHQTGYCPRGAFCAFAHVDQEMMTARDVPTPLDGTTNLAELLLNALPPEPSSCSNSTKDGESSTSQALVNDENNFPQISSTPPTMTYEEEVMHGSPLPAPIAKPRSQSLSSSLGNQQNLNLEAPVYQKAPGSEREDREVNIRKSVLNTDSEALLDSIEKVKRKHGLYGTHTVSSTTSAVTSTAAMTSAGSLTSTVSPLAPPFYPPSETVESVLGNALEDLNMDEPLNVAASLDRVLDNDSNSVSSSISAGLASSGILGSSAPVNIPRSSVNERNPLGNLSPPTSSPLAPLQTGFLSSSSISRQDNPIDSAAAAFLSQTNISISNTGTKMSSFSSPGFFDFSSHQNLSPSNRNPLQGGAAGPFINSFNSVTSSINSNRISEIHRLKEELSANRIKLASWEEGIQQARSACEAWKREAEDATRRAKLAEQQKEEAMATLNQLQKEVEQLQGGPYLHTLRRISDLKNLPIGILKTIQSQLRNDVDEVDKAVYHHAATKCMVCEENNISVAVLPCNHYVLCNSCASLQKECPYCRSQIVQRSSLVMPL